jgi:CRP-like cAMP-binding protein
VRRLRVALDWTLDLLFPRDITQLAVLRHEHLHVHHYEAGEAIVRQGQIGRELFVILSGEVEVSADGAGAVARLGARDVFGERALLEDTPRNATVRATRACDVLVLNRSEFHAMVRSLPVLSDYFLDLLRSRHPDALARAEPQLALGRE